MRYLILILLAYNTAFSNPVLDKYTKVFPFVDNEVALGDFRLTTGELTSTLTYTPKTIKHKGAVVIVPGWAEPIFRYDELYYDLKDLGVPIYGYDLISQGLSDRTLDDFGKTYVKSFDQYEKQLSEFLEKMVSNKHKKLVVISHSTGAQIALRYARKHPDTFARIILITPLFEIKIPEMLRSAAVMTAQKMVDMGYGKEYVIPKYLLKSYKNSAISNRATSSEERFKMAKEHWNKRYPSLSSIGPTWQWVLAAMKANSELAKLDFKSLKDRVTLFQAGDDYLVGTKKQDEFCKEVNCKKISFRKGKHWLHREVDEIRDVVIMSIKSDIKATLQ